MPLSEVVAPALATRESILEASGETAIHITREQETMHQIFLGLFFGLLATVIALTLIFSRFLTQPREELKLGSEVIGQGDLDYCVDVYTGDEFEDLGRSFNRMAADLREHISTLRITTAERERIQKELEIARASSRVSSPVPHPVYRGWTWRDSTSLQQK